MLFFRIDNHEYEIRFTPRRSFNSKMIMFLLSFYSNKSIRVPVFYNVSAKYTWLLDSNFIIVLIYRKATLSPSVKFS